ncbi:MAG: CheW domain-containing protein [Pseudomonas sp.]
MSRSVVTATRSQRALQSYLDALLQDAAIELAETVSQATVELNAVSLDEFEAAVLEEQVRDARQVPLALAEPQPQPLVLPSIEAPAALVEPVAEVHVPAAAKSAPAPLQLDGRPQWAEEPFECLLFDVAGLTLAVPLVCLGSIYALAGQELTPLFGQPDWFLGILPCQAGNLKVLDTARWVMPDRYRDDFRQGLQYVISVQGYEWGLAVHQVSRSIRLDPSEIKWRSQRSQRPWLAGTVIEHMCALLDVAALAELIASGAVKRLAAAKAH